MLKNLFAAVLALLAAAAFAAVDVNKADQAELETIKGIGPSLSQRILDERQKSAFRDWPDLIERIRGVGAGNAARFSTGGLTVNGSAYGGAAAAGARPAAGSGVRSGRTAASAASASGVPVRAAASRPVPAAAASAASTASAVSAAASAAKASRSR
jgi:competence protein ComEA